MDETVAFNPSAQGEASGVWQINGTDTSGLHEVRFSGVGVTPAAGVSLVQQAPGSLSLPSPQGSPGRGSHTSAPNAALVSVVLAASRSGTIAIPVSCPLAEGTCAGALTLRTLVPYRIATGHRSHRHRTGIVTLAAGRFTIPGGRVARVELRLSARARALLARMHVLRARATTTVRYADGSTHAAEVIVTIHAPVATHARKR